VAVVYISTERRIERPAVVGIDIQLSRHDSNYEYVSVSQTVGHPLVGFYSRVDGTRVGFYSRVDGTRAQQK
jgi:hypothetical protein